MKSFTQHFITYHGCGKCYLHGTNEIAKFGCANPTFNPFWKKQIHANNKISKSTRSRINNKTLTTRKYVKKYFHYLKGIENNKDTQWLDYSTDYAESDSSTDYA